MGGQEGCARTYIPHRCIKMDLLSGDARRLQTHIRKRCVPKIGRAHNQYSIISSSVRVHTRLSFASLNLGYAHAAAGGSVSCEHFDEDDVVVLADTGALE